MTPWGIPTFHRRAPSQPSRGRSCVQLLGTLVASGHRFSKNKTALMSLDMLLSGPQMFRVSF